MHGDMEIEEVQPELKDIHEMILRYIQANKKNVMFIGGFVAFKHDKGTCENCGGDDCNIVKEDASRLMIYGNLLQLRDLNNELRNAIEDEADETGFVNM